MKKITKEDLANNPIPRLASCLVLDTSISMGKLMKNGLRPIDELNKGVAMYMDAISKDEKTKEMVEISIVTFGNNEFSKNIPKHLHDPKKGVKKVLDFGYVNEGNAPTLSAGGYTPMGEAVEIALDMLDKRKQMYKETAGTYKQPWLVLMTDGYPYDLERKIRETGSYDGETINKSAKRTTELANAKKLKVIPVAIGDDANIDVLKKFSPITKPVKMNENLKFEEFFEFVTQTQAGDDQEWILGPSEDLQEII